MKSCFLNLNVKFECFFMFEFHNNRIYFSALIKSVSTLIKSTFSHTVYLSRASSCWMIVSIYLPTFKLCKEQIYFYTDAYTSYCSLLTLTSLQIVQPLLSYSLRRYLIISIVQLHCTNTRNCTFLISLLCHSHNCFKVFFMCIIFILSYIVFLQNLMQHKC